MVNTGNFGSFITKNLYSHLLIFTLFEKFAHSHKKRKDNLEGGLDRVLFTAELGFLKILVPRLPQHTSNVNIECTGKSEWPKHPTSWSTDTS